MLERLAGSLLRRRVLVLVVAVAVVGLAGVLGAGVVSKLRSGGFEDPAASSTRAEDALRDTFHTGEPNLVLLVTADHGTVDQADLANGGLELTRRLSAERDVSEVQSYWTTKAAPLRSVDGRQALVLARIAGDDDATQKRAEQLATDFDRDQGGMRVQVGGQARVFGEVSDQVERDLARAEMIAVPITLVLLVVVFLSAVAGALPLAVGGFAIVGTLLVLRLLAGLTDVSVYALNLTTALGLGLAIDYSMFIVSRYREELRAGREPPDALVTTMRTAGRTVLFSAATVAVALVALLVFPLYFLRSFGYAGIAVVALAAVGALVVLPALLAVLGRRIDSLRLPFGRRRAARRAAAQAADRFVAGGATWLRVVPTVEAYSSAGENLVERVRALPAPFGVEVGGPSAQLVDTKAAISDRLPMAVAVIAGATLLLLFLMTGSLVIPIKALILNLLSLSAVYGAMVFIFQDGHLSSLLGFTSTGTIDTSMPVLLSCIAFGLSMDYEVFLLSRIKEEYDRSGDTISSVATGLERSGRIVTTLAALLAIVFIAFATSQVTFLKLFGIGSALAIVVDATLIRALLVPAFMRLAGRANWWAPRPLRLLHDRIGLREDVPRRVAEVTRT